MCTGLEIGLILALSTAVSAAGAISSGIASANQAKFQAGIAGQQATRERQIAAAAEDDFRRRQSRVLAARRAALGGAGIVQGTGSALLVSEDFAGETELSALRIREGGEVRATRAEQQAELFRFKGSSAQTAGFLRGGALLIGGGADAAIAQKRFS